MTERDPQREKDARLHTALTGEVVQWRMMHRLSDGDWIGHTPWTYEDEESLQPCVMGSVIPEYRRACNGMFLVIEAMLAKGYVVEVAAYPSPDGKVYATTWKRRDLPGGHIWRNSAPTAPEAVAEAALAALEGDMAVTPDS